MYKAKKFKVPCSLSKPKQKETRTERHGEQRTLTRVKPERCKHKAKPHTPDIKPYTAQKDFRQTNLGEGPKPETNKRKRMFDSIEVNNKTIYLGPLFQMQLAAVNDDHLTRGFGAF